MTKDPGKQFPYDGEYPEEWVRKAHETLTQGDGMLRVVYMRQLMLVRKLKEQLREKEQRK